MGNQTRKDVSERARNKQNSAGDWVAPVLVWLVCIGLLSAMVSVLLGLAK